MDSPREDWHVSPVNAVDPTVAWLRDVLPPAFGVAGGAIGEPDASAYPIEELEVARAVAKRRFEFRAGRAYARQALSQIGCPPSAIARGAGGEALWPSGYTGSISHTDQVAIAVAARLDAVRAVGLDVETDAPLDASLADIVCRPDELAWGRAQIGQGADAAKRFLVAKEAFIKLSYALAATPVEVLDILVEFGEGAQAGQSFRATCVSASGAPSYQGRLACRGGRIMAVIYALRDAEF